MREYSSVQQPVVLSTINNGPQNPTLLLDLVHRLHSSHRPVCRDTLAKPVQGLVTPSVPGDTPGDSVEEISQQQETERIKKEYQGLLDHTIYSDNSPAKFS
ncbi:hypothetical protein J6590_080188 [Homalodisca vitripennis]|nr:hypothetical protein J6590_080188 [Homalodisca vitripennis]